MEEIIREETTMMGIGWGQLGKLAKTGVGGVYLCDAYTLRRVKGIDDDDDDDDNDDDNDNDNDDDDDDDDDDDKIEIVCGPLI
ncbi:hypothetical protein ElyMa_006989300 [Elysia marginata]|uniref:Uncharacterized protein n=1 Tax=Elysia marginata TaxID=1093978 RepID=A0AAV4JQF7_9GAST|nr:hypothetical protein ElyMa_006989300 [Elysia marginata]